MEAVAVLGLDFVALLQICHNYFREGLSLGLSRGFGIGFALHISGLQICLTAIEAPLDFDLAVIADDLSFVPLVTIFGLNFVARLDLRRFSASLFLKVRDWQFRL